MFDCKSASYLSKVLPAFLKDNWLGWKDLPGTNTLAIVNTFKLWTKKFYNIGPWGVFWEQTLEFILLQHEYQKERCMMCQCHFKLLSLLMTRPNRQEHCPWQPFQPGVMCIGKARSLPKRRASEMCSIPVGSSLTCKC